MAESISQANSIPLFCPICRQPLAQRCVDSVQMPNGTCVPVYVYACEKDKISVGIYPLPEVL